MYCLNSDCHHSGSAVITEDGRESNARAKTGSRSYLRQSEVVPRHDRTRAVYPRSPEPTERLDKAAHNETDGRTKTRQERPRLLDPPHDCCFPLSPTEHHRDFLLQNLTLFGASEDIRELDLVGIYQRGWVSIRKFEPPHDQWHVVYGQVNTALPILAQWADILLTDVPDESSALVVFTSVSEHAAAACSMQELAAGSLRKVGECDLW